MADNPHPIPPPPVPRPRAMMEDFLASSQESAPAQAAPPSLPRPPTRATTVFKQPFVGLQLALFLPSPRIHGCASFLIQSLTLPSSASYFNNNSYSPSRSLPLPTSLLPSIPFYYSHLHSYPHHSSNPSSLPRHHLQKTIMPLRHPLPPANALRRVVNKQVEQPHLAILQ